MNWRKTPQHWDRRDQALVLYLSIVAACGALAPFLGWAALVAIGVAVGGLVLLLARAWIGTKKSKLEKALEEAELNRLLRVKVAPIESIDPTAIGVDPAAQTVLRGGEIPDYLPRSVDQEIRDALIQALNRSGRWIVVVCGSSKVGKSRSLFEALRWCGEQRQRLKLIAPTSGDAIRSLLKSGQLPRPTEDEDLVVWLDDLETFVADGMSLEILREWHENSGVVFAATYGGKGSERLRDASESGLAVLADTLLQRATQINLMATTEAELELLPPDLPARFRQDISQHGLATAMVVGPALERKLVTGRHAMAQPECPAGVAVARAAIDWARCGRTDSIPREHLLEIWPSYLPAGTPPSTEQFEAGLEWALQPVAGTIALLRESTDFLPFDYIVSFIEDQTDAPAPTDAAWSCALDTTDPGQAFNVGIRAHAHSRNQDANTGMRIAARGPDTGPRATFNLGVLQKEEGDIETAIETFEQAATMGHGAAASNLGVLLREQGDEAGAEKAWRRAMEMEDGGGAFNLGLLFEKRNEAGESEAAWRRAMELGSGEAAVNLGVLLEERGDHEGSEAAWRRGMELEDGGAASNLGVLLREQGDEAGAEKAWRRAMELGSGSGAFNLGQSLSKRGDREGSEVAWQRAMELGDADAAGNLGLRRMNAGETKEAIDMLRRAAELGDGVGAANLGVLLDKQGDHAGAEEAFRRAIELGDGAGAFNLGILLAGKGDVVSARSALEQAVAMGSAEVAGRARERLGELPSAPEP